MRNTFRMGIVTTAVLGLLLGIASLASAHVPAGSATCDGVTASGTSYNPNGDNFWSIWERLPGDKFLTVVASGEFDTDFTETVPVPQGAATTDWEVNIRAWDDPDGTKGFTKTFTGTVGPCGKAAPKIAHLKIRSFNSCNPTRRAVVVTHRSDGIAKVTKHHGPNRHNWVIRAHTDPGFVMHKNPNGTGTLVHHVRWAVHLKHLGPCAPHPHTS